MPELDRSGQTAQVSVPTAAAAAALLLQLRHNQHQVRRQCYPLKSLLSIADGRHPQEQEQRNQQQQRNRQAN